MFKLEQEEYKREEIPWDTIKFTDNQPCIDLIEGKLGIVDYLDEETKMPQGNDESCLEKISQRHKDNSFYERPKRDRFSFTVKHFADNVQYRVDGFVEKNRDYVNDQLLNVILDSKVQ